MEIIITIFIKALKLSYTLSALHQIADSWQLAGENSSALKTQTVTRLQVSHAAQHVLVR